MTPTPKSASGGTARQSAVETGKPPEAVGPFVLNLTSSTTPMALSNPEQAELKRFSFFVSRRFEEGRERFRLHMGYFSTLREAEEWLVAVRDIYPGAWAGEAPGKKLRERAVAAAAAQAQHAAGPPPIVASKAAAGSPRNVPTLPGAQSAPVEVPALNVPTIHAAAAPKNVPVAKAAPLNGQPAMLNSAVRPAPVAARPTGSVPSVIGSMRSPKAAPVAPVAIPRAVAPTHGRSAAPIASVPVNPAAAARPPMAAVARAPAPGAGRPAGITVARAGSEAQPVETWHSAQGDSHPAQSSPAARGSHPTQGSHPAHGMHPAQGLHPGQASHLEHVSHPAQAGHSAKGSQPPKAAPTQQRPGSQPAARAHGAPTAPARPNAKAKAAFPNSNVREVLKALSETSPDAEVTGETRMMPAPSLAALGTAQADNNFTDTQVLKFLETRRADGSEITGVDVETGAISLLKPDDTGTRRALKEAVSDNAPVWFAVQLQWAVQPVELHNVPPLAIFSAYTLYTVEGSRDGRKWYGLRLGFFSDAISAKQVAYYVRSEFTSVAVVPVSPQERIRASDVEKKADLPFPKKTRQEPVDEFKLIDSDDQPAGPARGRQAAPKPAATKPAAPAKSAPPPRSAARGGPQANNGRVRARDARSPQTLEETLEILGAGELEMDGGHGETMNESGVRHLRVEVQKNTPFGRLLERLSERVRKP